MRFKIDENLPIECAEIIKKVGYEADTVFDEGLGGCPDSSIYSVCLEEKRILITLDLDFSDIRTYPPNRHYGIIVLRLINQSKKNVIEKITQIMPILQKEKIRGYTWIVDEKKVRIRGGLEWS
ncbi:MAG TPA: hypothetical protein DC024_04035 [Clostridiales bacterium]|jgi:predicted nuclease of predicted toxin-antitoxin system|nr:hypothetical protein [Clostridiales bacterium]